MDEIMGLVHTSKALEGIQFHPEAVQRTWAHDVATLHSQVQGLCVSGLNAANI